MRLCFSTKLLCNQDEKVWLEQVISNATIIDGNIKLTNQVDNHLEIYEKISLKKANTTLLIGEVLDHSERILLIYRNASGYLFQEFRPSFYFLNNKPETNLEPMVEQYFFNSQECNIAYSIFNLFYLICDVEDKYIIYKKQKYQQMLDIQTINKQGNCKFQMKGVANFIIYILKNCEQWFVQIYNQGDEFLKEINFNLSNQPLKNLEISQYSVELYLQFEHQVYRVSIGSFNTILFYEDNGNLILKILKNLNGFIIVKKQDGVNEQEIYEDLNSKTFFFVVTIPSDSNIINLVVTTTFINILYDSYFLYFSQKSNRWEKYNTTLTQIKNYYSPNLILGFDDDGLIVINQLDNDHLIDCNKISGNTAIKLESKSLFEYINSTNIIQFEKVYQNEYRLIREFTNLKKVIDYMGMKLAIPIVQGDFMIGQPSILIQKK